MAESERRPATDSDVGTKVAELRQRLAARQGLEARSDANRARPDPAFDLAAVTAELDANRQAIAALDAALAPAERARLVFTPSTLSDLTTAASAADEAALVITDLGGPWLVTVASGGRTQQYLQIGRAHV